MGQKSKVPNWYKQKVFVSNKRTDYGDTRNMQKKTEQKTARGKDSGGRHGLSERKKYENN